MLFGLTIMPRTRRNSVSIKRLVLHRLEHSYSLWTAGHRQATRNVDLAQRLLAQWAHAQRFELRDTEQALVEGITRRLRHEERVLECYLAPAINLAALRRMLLALHRRHWDSRIHGPLHLWQTSLRELFAYCDDEALANYAARRQATSLRFARALAQRRHEVERIEDLLQDKIEFFAPIGAFINRHLYAYRDVCAMPQELGAITEKFITASVAFEAHLQRNGQAAETPRPCN